MAERQSALLLGGCQSSPAPWFQLCWPAGQTISIRPNASAMPIAGTISSAVSDWNSAFWSARTPNVPRFAYTEIDPAPDFWVDWDGNTTVCGEEVGGVIHLHGGCPAEANKDAVAHTLMHELTEPYGFTADMEKKGVAGVSDHCVNTLPTDKNHINSAPCQHEIEIVLQAYGYRGTIDPDSFMTKHVLTGFDVSPGSLSFTATGQTAQLSVTRDRFDRGSPSLEGYSPPIGVAWSSDSLPIASVSSAGLVTAGTQNGTTVIRARASGTLPADVQIGGLMQADGTSIPVTVNIPPPPNENRVTDITGIPVPVTAAGSYPATAHVSGGATSVRWTLIFSDGPDTLTTGFGPLTQSFVIHAGSYRLTVTATPNTGTALTLFFPVCTGGQPPPLAPQGQVVPHRPGGC